ncbi:MAG: hypothetical protein ABJ263_10795 [Tateyamaria sp.]|uniref:hypothetical protein n=1 Tax=Tateyamaria sp. TaxID=1929288 RepID=UPI003292CF3E
MSSIPLSVSAGISKPRLARIFITATVFGALANATAPALLVAEQVGGLPDVGVSKVVLCCVALGLFRLLQAPRAEDLLPFMLPAAIGALLRSADAAWLGLSISMLLLLTANRTTGRARDGATVLLAVGLHAPIVSAAGLLIGGDLLALDTKLAAAFLSLSGTPVSASAASLSVPGGMDLLLVWRCGVLGNLSVALMMWYTATRFVLGCVPARALPTAVLVATVMVAVNALRIAGMAFDAQTYEWLHDGRGASLVRMAALACVAGIIAFDLRRLSA